MPVATPAQTHTAYTTYADNIMQLRYSHTVSGRVETWEEIAERCVAWVMGAAQVYLSVDLYDAIFEIIRDRKFIPGGRILSQTGRSYHQTDNCFTLQAEDTREGWADLAHKCTMMFMSGGGVGVDYSQLRPYGTSLKRSGGISSGPIPLINMVNSIASAVRQGGERRGACYASLVWDHADIEQFIEIKACDNQLQHTNISVRFDTAGIEETKEQLACFDSDWPQNTFLKTLQYACRYGDPGFQFDNDNNILRNACTEIISADDSDSCCLGSINLANIDNLQELGEVVNLAILFLLCNTLYTDKPTEKVKEIKAKNRRLGLGLMGVAEWFIQRSMPYGFISPHPTYDFGEWLHTYKHSSDHAADIWSDKLQIARPIAVRAIAPTGTISIAGGHTTPGIEPVFHTCYKRTYNTLKTQHHSNGYHQEIVVEPVVQKLIQQGYDVRDIDTAYTLSQTPEGIEQRIAFQAFCQRYVDNAISSTVNLPQYVPGIEEKIAPILLKYLPQLRGITFYPDGRYENQPVQPVDISQYYNDQVILGQYESCKGDICGI